MRKLGHPCNCITEGSPRLDYRPSVPYSHRALRRDYARTVHRNRPRGVGREGRVTSTFTSPGNPQSSYREPTHMLSIHLDPNLRLLQERGLLHAPSPGDSRGTPKVHKSHLLSEWTAILEAFLYSAVAGPHMSSICVVLQEQ